MKKLSLVAALALGGLLACTTARAQDTNAAPKKEGKGPRFSIEQRMDMYSNQLSLTDDQKPKVKAVLEETQKSMQGLREVPQDERREKMQSIRQDEAKKMKDILTPDQYEKYTKMMENMKKGGRKKKADQ
ncbi:MAG TPA: hypothetical protein VMU04_00085 [Candidatus Acidoferrum sp.]|nr:hypothetical protein [Candidatus Acidoferrum sp.]